MALLSSILLDTSLKSQWSKILGGSSLYSIWANSLLSIVAVTGLAGHALGSWRGKGTLRKMWLKDFLQDDLGLPDCRTMIYGYDSLLKSYGVHGVGDYATDLIMALRTARRSPEVSTIHETSRYFFLSLRYSKAVSQNLLGWCALSCAWAHRTTNPFIAIHYFNSINPFLLANRSFLRQGLDR